MKFLTPFCLLLSLSAFGSTNVSVANFLNTSNAFKLKFLKDFDLNNPPLHHEDGKTTIQLTKKWFGHSYACSVQIHSEVTKLSFAKDDVIEVGMTKSSFGSPVFEFKNHPVLKDMICFQEHVIATAPYCAIPAEGGQWLESDPRECKRNHVAIKTEDSKFDSLDATDGVVSVFSVFGEDDYDFSILY